MQSRSALLTIIFVAAGCSGVPAQPQSTTTTTSTSALTQCSEDNALGNPATRGDPALAMRQPGTLDVVYTGLDGNLYHRAFANATWSAQDALNGAMIGRAAAIGWAPNQWFPTRLEVFVQGTDHNLYRQWFDGQWRGWSALGGPLGSSPTVASWGTGRLDVFYRRTDGTLGHRSADGGGAFSAEESLGGTIAGDPTAVSWGPGRIDVFARSATDGALLHLAWDGSWHPWERLGGQLASSPTVTSRTSGHLDVFWRSQQGTLRHRALADGAWEPEDDFGGPIGSAPSAAAAGADSLDAVFADGAGLLHQRRWRGANAALGFGGCTPGGATVLPGTWTGTMTLIDSGLPSGAGAPGVAPLRVPVTAVAGDATGAPTGAAPELRANAWVMLVEPLGGVTPSGKVLATLAAPYQSTTDELFSAATHQPDDGLSNTGGLRARIHTEPDGAPRLTKGKLTGEVLVEIPVTTTQSGGWWGPFTTTTNATQKWAFVLERTGELSTVHACGQCVAGEACDARIGVCLPGRSGPSGTGDAIGTLAHTLFARWPSLVDTTVDRAASGSSNPWSLAALPNLYVPLGNRGTAGKLPYAHVIGRERLFQQQRDLAYAICQRDFHSLTIQDTFAEANRGYGTAPWFGFFKKTSPYARGCTPSGVTRQLIGGNLCDAIYDSRSLWSDSGSQCTYFDDPHYLRQRWRNGYLPCLQRDDSPSNPGTVTLDGHDGARIGTFNFNCTGLHDQLDAWNKTTTSLPEFLSTCQESEVTAEIWQGWSGGMPRRVYLCPVSSELDGTRDWPGAPVPGSNAERLSCFDPTNQSGPTLLASTELQRLFGGDLAPFGASKDAPCWHPQSTPQLAFPLYAYRDRFPDPNVLDPLKAKDMLDACARDLATPLPPSPTATTVFRTDTQCISPPRFFTALRDASGPNPALFNRLSQQWIGMHGFLSLQGAQGDELLAAIGDDTTVIPASPLEHLDRLLEQLDDGLALALDVGVAPRLVAAANAGDYRTKERWGASGADFGTGDQGLSLAITLLETTTSYLGVTEQLVVQTAQTSITPCDPAAPGRVTTLARAGRSLRLAAALAGLADSIAVATDGAHLDANRWARARQSYAVRRQGVVDRGADLARCTTPENAENDSVPVVFNDATGTAGRFFASSKYLRQTAQAEVDESGRRLTDARSAWKSARDSHIQALATNLSMQQRIDDLSAHYGEPVTELCGLSGMQPKDVLAAFDPSTGSLRPASCFVVPNVTCQSDRDAPCYRGTMGEAALSIVAAREDVLLSQRVWQDAQNAYDTQFLFCRNLQQELDQEGRLLEAHEHAMAQLRSAKLIADEAALVADAAKECSKLFDEAESGGGECVASSAGSVAKIISAGLAKKMESSKALWDAEVQLRQYQRQSEACFHEADMKRIGVDTAAEQIQRRMIDLQASLLKLANAQNKVRSLVVEGAAAVARERARALPSVEFHYWVDEKVSSFREQFPWAKHAAFLAVKSVEYDFQQSLGLRGEVLAATRPSKLASALLQLDDIMLGQSINGNAPGNHVAVFSVRDTLLGLNAQNGQTPAERLRARLRAPESQFRDRDGNLLGVGLPFSLPKSLTASDRCAERVWRVSFGVNAHGPYTSDRGPLELHLFKRNTFSSRLCGGRGEPGAMQVGTSQTLGYFFAGHAGRAPELSNNYSVASANALPAGTAAELSTGDFGSEELAGRGLFGDYILVVPASQFGHLAVDAIDDLYVRVDYEDVADARL